MRGGKRKRHNKKLDLNKVQFKVAKKRGKTVVTAEKAVQKTKAEIEDEIKKLKEAKKAAVKSKARRRKQPVPILERKALDYMPVDAGMRKDLEARRARREATRAAREERRARRQEAREKKERLGKEEVSLKDGHATYLVETSSELTALRLTWIDRQYISPVTGGRNIEISAIYSKLEVDPVGRIMAEFSEDCVYEDTSDLSREQEAFVGFEEVKRYQQETKDSTPDNLRFFLDEVTDGDKACTVLWHVEFNSRMSPRGVSYYELNEEGKVCYVRSAYDINF
eukprot:s694_g20.t1